MQFKPDFEPVLAASSLNEALVATVGAAQNCEEGMHEQLTAVAGNRIAAPNVEVSGLRGFSRRSARLPG